MLMCVPRQPCFEHTALSVPEASKEPWLRLLAGPPLCVLSALTLPLTPSSRVNATWGDFFSCCLIARNSRDSSLVQLASAVLFFISSYFYSDVIL